MFLHSAAAIILTVPIVMPLVHQVGIDPIHFGLVLTLNLAIGQQTPPVASVLIAACSIAKSDIWETTKANLGFIGVLVGVLMLCSYAVVLVGADQGVVPRLAGHTPTHDPRAGDHRLHFSEGHIAPQIFHAAVGSNHDTLGRHIWSALRMRSATASGVSTIRSD